MNKNKPLSTYDRLMQDKGFKKEFDAGYREFLLSELICALMEEDNQSVRELAKEVGLSPTVIQKIRSGKQKDMKVSNFIGIAKECGYDLILQKGKEKISMNALVTG